MLLGAPGSSAVGTCGAVPHAGVFASVFGLTVKDSFNLGSGLGGSAFELGEQAKAWNLLDLFGNVSLVDATQGAVGKFVCYSIICFA